MNEPAPIMEVKMMTREEAQKRVISINSQMNNIRQQLLDFYERRGWAALGYDSWTACVEKEFGQSRQHLYRQLEAAKVEKNLNEIAGGLSPMGDTSPIPERILRPLSQVDPEDQSTVYALAKETAPEGKVTAKHVEKVVREIKEASAKTYRIRNTRTKEWWEGKAISCSAAVSASTWPVEECEIKEKTLNGAGGWRKVKHKWPEPSVALQVDCQGCPDHRGMINKHHGIKVPGNSGKCIREGGPCEKSSVPAPQDHPAPPLPDAGDGVNTGVPYFTDLAIRAIDKIKDEDPGCKEALVKIAVHVWNRQHHKQEEGK